VQRVVADSWSAVFLAEVHGAAAVPHDWLLFQCGYSVAQTVFVVEQWLNSTCAWIVVAFCANTVDPTSQTCVRLRRLSCSSFYYCSQ
jgi:hypothetical protein